MKRIKTNERDRMNIRQMLRQRPAGDNVQARVVSVNPTSPSGPVMNVDMGDGEIVQMDGGGQVSHPGTGIQAGRSYSNAVIEASSASPKRLQPTESGLSFTYDPTDIPMR